MKKRPTVNTPAINLLSMRGTALLKVLISVTITGLLIVADMERRKVRRTAQNRKLAFTTRKNLESSLHNWLAQPGTIAYSFGQQSTRNSRPLVPGEEKLEPEGEDARDDEIGAAGWGTSQAQTYLRTTAYRGMDKNAYRADTISFLGEGGAFRPLIPRQISVWSISDVDTGIWINGAPAEVPRHVHIYMNRAMPLRPDNGNPAAPNPSFLKYFATHIIIPDIDTDGTFKTEPGSGTLKLMPGNGALRSFIGYPNRDGTNIQSISDGGLTYIRAMWVEAAEVYAPPPSIDRDRRPVANEWAIYHPGYMEGMVHFKVLTWTFVNPLEYRDASAQKLVNCPRDEKCVTRVLSIPIYAKISYNSITRYADGRRLASSTASRLDNIIDASFGLECKRTQTNIDPTICDSDNGFFLKITNYNQKKDATGKLTEDSYDGRCCKPVSKSQL